MDYWTNSRNWANFWANFWAATFGQQEMGKGQHEWKGLGENSSPAGQRVICWRECDCEAKIEGKNRINVWGEAKNSSKQKIEAADYE